MKILYIYLIITIGLLFNAFGQDDCILKLQEAEKMYEEGKIELVEPLLKNCLNSGFNRENRIQAYRLLALVQIFEDNSELAENYLLKILKINPEYKYNESVDPLEFIRLYNTINTNPVLSIGVLFGTNITNPLLRQTYTVNNYKNANAKYTSNGIGIELGLRCAYHLNNNIDIVFEPTYTNQTFKLSEQVTDVCNTYVSEDIALLDFPINVNYFFYQQNKISYYAEAGLIYRQYISGSRMFERVYTDNEQPSIPELTIKSDIYRRHQNFAAAIGAGVQYKLSRSNLQFLVKYKFGLTNLTNPENRYNNVDNIITDYYFIDNNFNINGLSVNISYNYQFYNHKRKK